MRENIQKLKWNYGPRAMGLDNCIVDFYMALLVNRSKRNKMNVYAMNSAFYPEFINNRYDSGRKIPEEFHLFQHEMVLIPIGEHSLEHSHWKLCVIFVEERKIKCYNSKKESNRETLENLKAFLAAEINCKHKYLSPPPSVNDWTMEDVKDIPCQKNTFDCGVFTCMYAEYLTRGKEFNFEQRHMTYFRKKMLYEICESEMLN